MSPVKPSLASVGEVYLVASGHRFEECSRSPRDLSRVQRASGESAQASHYIESAVCMGAEGCISREDGRKSSAHGRRRGAMAQKQLGLFNISQTAHSAVDQ